jgi:hypothetical protein
MPAKLILTPIELNRYGTAAAGYQLSMADIGQAACRKLGSSIERSARLVATMLSGTGLPDSRDRSAVCHPADCHIG